MLEISLVWKLKMTLITHTLNYYQFLNDNLTLAEWSLSKHFATLFSILIIPYRIIFSVVIIFDFEASLYIGVSNMNTLSQTMDLPSTNGLKHCAIQMWYRFL